MGRVAHAALPPTIPPDLMPWLVGAVLLALIVLVLWFWQHDLMHELRDRVLVTLDNLPLPLRSRRWIIHDPEYLRKVLEAEAASANDVDGTPNDNLIHKPIMDRRRINRDRILALLELPQRPLRNRHRVIHDRDYVSALLEAEAEHQSEGAPFGMELQERSSQDSPRGSAGGSGRSGR